MDLAEFLTARWDEEEAVARAATPGPWKWTGDYPQGTCPHLTEWSDHGPDLESTGASVTFASGEAAPALVITSSGYDASGLTIEDANADHIAYHDPAHVLADIAAKRAVLGLRAAPMELVEWTPDCGGDWVLSSDRYFANYWPDHSWSAAICADADKDKELADSGIVTGGRSLAACQAAAEEWVIEHLVSSDPILLALAQPYADHPDFDPEWRH